MFLHLLVFLSLAASCILSIPAFGATLPNDEVEALRVIAKKLGKTDWNFNVDPCSGESSWVNPYSENDIYKNVVTCNCSFSNATICHVLTIKLEGQGLQGVLPPELARLPFLQNIHLSRNYLSGSIPPEWGSLQLLNISLDANRLTGPIPVALANISTLTNFSIEANRFSGSLPPQLGNLPNIERMLLNSNNFTGALPETFAKLTTLKDFWISDNHFTGPIPNFIENWTNLGRLFIQASGLVGPIPSGIAALVNLTHLRISDLKGMESTFPPLSGMKKLTTLILRSCNIIGQLPHEYLASMTDLVTLDLSFNKLSGEIPSSFSGLSNAKYIFLTGNLLSGEVPPSMLDSRNIDLSYNNLTTDPSKSCQDQNMNLFASSFKGSNFGGIVSCLRDFKCPRTYYSLHINCGGNEVKVNGTTFEDNRETASPSIFIQKSGSNWGFSNTGRFLDKNIILYTWPNSSTLLMNDPELYKEARLSPISLTYYGYCMANGNYTVSLHFAEIMFTNDKKYSSLGRRIFNVYIQEKLILEDFNIMEEASGAGKAITKSFSIAVMNSTLEIRLYWAGKGTESIPSRGVYGPLISVISVTSNFRPPSESVSVGTILGIVVGATFLVIMVLGIIWWKGCLKPKSTMELDLKGTGSFTLRQIKAATNNFDLEYKIGEGGFGPVYKGLLADGNVIAVKQLSSNSKQGNREFVNEIGMISALQHPHLVKLYGCCIEGNQLLLVYEFLENNSLARALFGPEEHQLNLDWPTRHKICVGIARGLAYLHEESRLKIVHRDIKATNVLLDKDLNPKISDFGLAKLDEEDNTHISTRVAGTLGYMAPEYAMRGYLTDKADVYSFGIVALEIVSGRSNTSFRQKQDAVNQKQDAFYLLDWALLLKKEGKLMELVDPKLGSDFNKEEVMVMINVALLCADTSPSIRPCMSIVVSMLEGRAAVPDFVPDSVASADEETKSEAMRRYYEFSREQTMNQSQTQSQSVSVDGPWSTASTSANDLYPLVLDKDYWKTRN